MYVIPASELFDDVYKKDPQYYNDGIFPSCFTTSLDPRLKYNDQNQKIG